MAGSLILSFAENEQSMYNELCSLKNLELAFCRARKGKSFKPYVIEFEKNLAGNLRQLQEELLSSYYRPFPLKTFIISDPKTRKISKSHFRDRVVHHALCNIIEPIFQKLFIHDSFANQKGKGTLKAIERLDCFKKKVSLNNSRICYLLKSDIKHYFETVDHGIMLGILRRKISDGRIMQLIQVILENYKSKMQGKGMPLGNLTSQFFANVYLNELDQFVKHQLRAKYYIRYVDDFVILHKDKRTLEYYKDNINRFLQKNLALELHPSKTRLFTLQNGIDFLGLRVFFHHKLIRKKNIKKFERKFWDMKNLHKSGMISRENAVEKFEGWLAYASHANTYKYRRNLVRMFNHAFPADSGNNAGSVKKCRNFYRKIDETNFPFSSQKTLHLYKEGMSVREIAHQRAIRESTVWEHFAKLVEYNQLSLWKLLPREKISRILARINSPNDRLKEIKERINDVAITFDEINCVLAFVKKKGKKNNLRFEKT